MRKNQQNYPTHTFIHMNALSRYPGSAPGNVPLGEERFFIIYFQGILPLPPKECWSEMIAGLNDSPRWNPTVIESRVSIN